MAVVRLRGGVGVVVLVGNGRCGNGRGGGCTRYHSWP